MKINNLGYLIREGIRSIFLHSFMSFAAVFVTVACLLIVGSFSAVTYNLNKVINTLNESNEVMVYIDETMEEAEARTIGTRLNRVSNVRNVEFISREQATQDFIAKHNDTDAFEGIDSSTFRHRFRVQLHDNRLLEDTKTALGQVPGVALVKAADKEAKLLVSIQDAVSMVSVVVIVALLIVSLMIISNTVKLAMADRRDEIAIMRMVGATNGFIRLPFVVQGFLLGMIGAGIAFGLEWLIYNSLANQLASYGAGALLKLVPFTDLLWPMVLVFAGGGMFVGITGSFASIRKFMDV